jgi:hypothetical protein
VQVVGELVERFASFPEKCLYNEGHGILGSLLLSFQKVLYCHHDYRLDYERYFLGDKFQNSKLFCHFYYTERLPQVIYVRLR